MAILTTKPLSSIPLGSTPLGSRELGSSDDDDSSLFFGMSAGLLDASRGAGTIYVWDGVEFKAITDPLAVPTIGAQLVTPAKRVADLTVRPMYREWTPGAVPVTGDVYYHNSQDGSTRLVYCETGGNAMPSMWGLQRADRYGASASDTAGNWWTVGVGYAIRYGAYFEPSITQIVPDPAALTTGSWTINNEGIVATQTSNSLIQGYNTTTLEGPASLTAEYGLNVSVGIASDDITVGCIMRRMPGYSQATSRVYFAASDVFPVINWDTGLIDDTSGSDFSYEWLPGGWVFIHCYGVSIGSAQSLVIRPSGDGQAAGVEVAYLGAWVRHVPVQPIPEAATRPGDGAANAAPTRQETLDATVDAGKTLVFAHASTDGARGYISTRTFYDSMHYSLGLDTDPRIGANYSGGTVGLDPIESGAASNMTPSYSSSIKWATAGTSITAEGFEVTDQPAIVSNTNVDFTFFGVNDGGLPLRLGVFNTAASIREMTLRACGIWTDAEAFDFDSEFGSGLYSGQPLPTQTAPVISSVSPSATSDSITVDCETDESCDVVLAISGGGTDESLNGSSHSLTVGGLAAETLYSWTLTATSNHTGLITVDNGNTETMAAGVTPVTVTMTAPGAETWTKTGDAVGTLSTAATVSDPAALLNWRIDGGAWAPTPLGASGNQAIDFPGLSADGVADYLVDATVDDTGSYSGSDSETYLSDDLSDPPVGGIDPDDTLFANHAESGTRNYTVTPPAGSSPGDYCFVLVQTAHGSEPNSYPPGLTKINWTNSGANGIAALSGPVKAGNAGWDFGHQYNVAWQSCVISNAGASDVQSAGAWTIGDSSDPITIPDSVVAAGGAGIPIAGWTSDRNTMQGTEANKGVWATDNGDTVHVRWHNSGSGDDNVPAVGTTGTPSLNVSYRAVILSDGAQLGSISMASSLAGRSAGSFTFTLVE